MDRPFPQSLLLLFVVFVICAERTKCEPRSIRFDPRFRSLGRLGQSHYFHHKVALNWHAANRTCRRYKNTHLVTIPDEETFYFLTVRTAPWWKPNDKGSFWFGAHEVKFNSWRWQNDQFYQGRIAEYHRGTKNTCGLVDGGSSSHLAGDTCTLKKRYLCVKPDVDSSNLRPEDYYVSTTAETVIWYQAKQICWSRGMDLAMAKNNSVAYIYRLLNESPQHFWIGLQKARYVWESTREAIHYLPFQTGEPNDWGSAEDCLHVKQNGYNDRACSESSSFICEWENKTGGPYAMASKQRKEPEKEESGKPVKEETEKQHKGEKRGEAGVTMAIVLSVLALIAVVSLIVVLVVQRTIKGIDLGNRWQRFREEQTANEGIGI